MGVLCACKSMHHIHVWSLHRPKEGINSPETVGKDYCEPPCRCWKPNPGPCQEKLVLLTIELSLQTLISSFSPVKHIAVKHIYMYISLYHFLFLQDRHSKVRWMNMRMHKQNMYLDIMYQKSYKVYPSIWFCAYFFKATPVLHNIYFL